MERKVRGGIGMGNTCKPMVVSFQCMTKSTTIKKKKEKKKEKHTKCINQQTHTHTKESACQGRGQRLEPCSGKILHASGQLLKATGSRAPAQQQEKPQP